MESTAEVTTLRTDPRYIAQFNAALTRFQRHMELHANDAPFEDITSDDEDDEERNQCRFLTPVSLDDQDVTSYQSLQNHHEPFTSSCIPQTPTTRLEKTQSSKLTRRKSKKASIGICRKRPLTRSRTTSSATFLELGLRSGKVQSLSNSASASSNQKRNLFKKGISKKISAKTKSRR